MKLQELRKRIDETDEKILGLLSERARLAKEAAIEKASSGTAAFVPSREQQLIASLQRKNNGLLPNSAVQKVFSEIVSACRAIEASLKIAFLGPEATFSQEAALKKFGSGATFVPCGSIAEVFKVVENRNADYGVVPIESSAEGTVSHTLDNFLNSNLSIVAETVVEVKQNLLSGEKNIGAIKTLYSHPQALAQCNQWVAKNLAAAKIVEAPSTAMAAELAAKKKGAAAIASSLAAEKFGLNLLAEGIQDNAQNLTRFLVIGNGKARPQKSAKDKTSIVFSVKHEPGTLFKALRPLQSHGLNMTKIESRPTRQKAWEVVFFIDFEGFAEDEKVQAALKEMKEQCLFLRILGSYPEEVSVSE
jgi:chorismate mutase/prephenate dehydratase